MGTSTAWEAGKMAIRTVFTERFQVTHPLVLAPMAGASGGTPAAAVPHAGGFGLAGSGHRDPSWLERELRTVAAPTSHAAGSG
jgi:nitronate monooxygenase